MRRLALVTICLPLITACGHKPAPVPFPVEVCPALPDWAIYDCVIAPFDSFGSEFEALRNALECELKNNARLRARENDQ